MVSWPAKPQARCCLNWNHQRDSRDLAATSLTTLLTLSVFPSPLHLTGAHCELATGHPQSSERLKPDCPRPRPEAFRSSPHPFAPAVSATPTSTFNPGLVHRLLPAKHHTRHTTFLRKYSPPKSAPRARDVTSHHG